MFISENYSKLFWVLLALGPVMLAVTSHSRRDPQGAISRSLALYVLQHIKDHMWSNHLCSQALLLRGKPVFTHLEGGVETERLIDHLLRKHHTAVGTMDKPAFFQANVGIAARFG